MTFSQLALNSEEQPWEPRLLRTQDTAQASSRGRVKRKAILLPGLSLCSSWFPSRSTWLWLAFSNLLMVLVGGLALLHLARAFGYFFLCSAYELGKQTSSSPWKLPPSMSFPILVPRETCFFIFFHIDIFSCSSLNYRNLR